MDLKEEERHACAALFTLALHLCQVSSLRRSFAHAIVSMCLCNISEQILPWQAEHGDPEETSEAAWG